MMDAFNRMKKTYEIVGDVRGMGLVLGIEIVRDKKSKEAAADLTKQIIDRAAQKGLILIAPIGFYGNVIRVAPPLMISEDLMMKGVEIIEECIREVGADNLACG